MNDKRICIFGEVLFDHFPDGSRVLGGAPFNVAWHLQAFGQRPYFISRVGRDPEGDAIRKAMRDWNMDTAGLQTDDKLPTGQVAVTFDDGEPSYDIVHPCAYDAITADDVADCQLLYHGSLALRSPASMAALSRLTDAVRGRIFVDVNLRPPWWSSDTLHEVLQRADWVKLNNHELRQMHADHADDSIMAATFLANYDLQGLIVTLGDKGAGVFTRDGQHEHVSPQRSSNIVDTVGAGDAFASVIILGLVQQWPLRTTLQRAQTFASKIVDKRGATVSDPAFYRTLADAWN